MSDDLADGTATSPPAQPSADGETSLGELVPAVYDELRAIAHRHLAARSGANGASLATTALVHEAYLKLASAGNAVWRDRNHFLAVAAVAMRQILVDRARARASLKRGGERARVTLEEDALAADDQPEALLEIDEALGRLALVSPRLARVVVLRFFGGLSEEEIAASLDVTPRTVQRDWAKARMLLRQALDA